MSIDRWSVLLLVGAACNSPVGADTVGTADTGAGTVEGTDADGSDGVDSTGSDPDTGGDPPPDHDGALGCAGVYNPDQVLDLHLDLDPASWQSVLADLSFSTYVEAQFHCGDEEPILVGVRRKRSGGTNKVGLKIDFNEFVGGQRWQDLKKISLENGVSSGSPSDDVEIGNLIGEYLGWRIMERGQVIGSRAAFANLYVNDELIGTYVSVEQVDKRFLEDRFGDNDGWLVKKSGGSGDGPKTHETDGLSDPYAAFFCFWETGGQACEPPSDDVLLAELPEHLDLPQMLRMGAVNAYMGNTDGPIFKDNNWYYYDWAGGGRAYLPTDLDTTMRDSIDVMMPSIGGSGGFEEVLFVHWAQDYQAVLTELVEDQVPAAVVLEELDRVREVAGPSIDADPWVVGTTADAVDGLESWWTEREADVRVQLGL